MNTSQFMDKQIMDLSNSKSNDDFIDLMNPQEDRIRSGKKEEGIVPSYDFQPIRPTAASQLSSCDADNVGGTKVWNSADSKINTTGVGIRVSPLSLSLSLSPKVWNSADSKINATGVGIRNYSSFDSIEPAKVVLEKDHVADNAALVSEIDRTMKKHADNLLHALEGVSARISQLESRTRHLENSVDDLKISFGNNSGSTDGKLRQLENILREVQADVQIIRDKQDIVEGQLQLAKLQVSNMEQQSESQNTMQSESLQPAVSAPRQSHQQLTRPAIIQSPSLSLPNAPPPASQQFLPPSVQLPNQFPPNQIPSMPQREPYFPPSQTQDSTNQQYQLPPLQQLPPPVPAPPQQQYQPPPPPQYSQPPIPPPPQQYSQPPPPPPSQYSQPPPPPPPQHPSLSAVNPPLPQPSLGHHLDEAPYAPQQNYPQNQRQPPHQPPSGNSQSQQFYGAPHHVYEPPSSRPNSGYSTSYGPSSGANDPYPYSGSASQYGGGSMKQPQLSSAVAQGGGGGYPGLPTARILPQALPTASGVSGGSGSAGTGDRAPIDEVVDKVTNMGFPRDQVRATVRKLTEKGQSADLNVVLDKLMNDGEGQPPRGWFGR